MLKEAGIILMVLLQGLTAPNYLQAQEIQEKTLVRIEMKDGNEFIGAIESESESEVNNKLSERNLSQSAFKIVFTLVYVIHFF